VYYDREISNTILLANVETPIVSMSCPTVSACIATDYAGNVLRSTDPAGGPSAWTLTKVFPWPSTPPKDVTSFAYLTCASATRCVGLYQGSGEAGEGPREVRIYADANYAPFGAASWDPTIIATETIPKPYSVGLSPAALSCPSVQLCVATDQAGQIIIGQAEVLPPSRLAHLVRAAVQPPSVLSTRALLHQGSLSLRFTPPVEGSLRMSLLTPSTSRQPHYQRHTVAIGLYTFDTPASESVELRLTSFGRRFLKHHHRARLTMQLTFKPTEASAVTASESLVLRA
jgi:hypothetical protein